MRPLAELRIRPFALLLLLSATAACASFKSVTATAELGEKLEAYSGAFDESFRYCDILQKATGTDSAKCAQMNADKERWRRATQVLVGYSGALKKLAAEDDITVKDNLKAVLTIDIARDVLPELSKDQADGFASAAEAITQALSREYRRAEIVSTIKAVNPHIKTLVDKIITNIQLQREVLKGIHDALEATIKAQSPDARFGTYALLIWIEDQSKRLDEFEKAAKAFLDAHQKLVDRADRLDSDDAAIYLDILKSAQTAYKGVVAATTPPKK